MIRFYEKRSLGGLGLEITILSEKLILNEYFWQEGKEVFRKSLCDTKKIKMLPVTNEDHEIVCYAYQDDEANRELRMLRELETHKDALQFKDIFPEIREVIIYGCNELAYFFAEYLKKQRVNVLTRGRNWEEFEKYKDDNISYSSDDQMVIYAETSAINIDTLGERIKRSASPEFECIDKIYEANVKKGKIKDIEEDFSDILNKLKDKRVVVLGTDARAQDAYDFLYMWGIDIYCFTEEGYESRKSRMLLGKEVVEIGKIIANGENFAFITPHDHNSALGNRDIEFLDYYGYARNEGFFLINDYTDIPFSNLVHVLKGKEVWLAGVEELCALLSDYFKEVEQGNVDIKYVNLSQCGEMKKETILCIVYPWYGERNMMSNPKFFFFQEELKSLEGNMSYTDYFSCIQALIAVDLYLNREKEKYTLKKICPKGILLGRIPPACGNIFFRGILDGHPDILKWGYNPLNSHLFLFCICLAREKSQDILKVFKKIYMEEYIYQLEFNIMCWDKFQKSIEKLLCLKDFFSSQELFIIFHIAYEEMMRNKEIDEIGDKVIYYEPHNVSRDEFPFLAQWLDSAQVNGQTIYMHRDNIVWMGSWYKFNKEKPTDLAIFSVMSRDDMTENASISYQYWKEFHVRFEDIKLHPKKELIKICDKFDIPWLDILMKTTKEGQAWDYQGITDFDIKPVFNKYEEYLSEFDRFRISLISSSYQKMYGYTYETQKKFTRKELWNMFLKKFKFQEKLLFENEKFKNKYFFDVYELMRWSLWKARKHEVLDDIIPKFDPIDIGQSVPKEKLDKEATVKVATYEEVEKLAEFIKQQEKLILYGIGKDCEALLEYLGDGQLTLLFCDILASYKEVVFHGRLVISPKELCDHYADYVILITSSRYYKSIRGQLIELGISADRIISNTLQLWENK